MRDGDARQEMRDRRCATRRCATEMRDRMRDRRNNPQMNLYSGREPLLALMRRPRGNRDSLIRETLLHS